MFRTQSVNAPVEIRLEEPRVYSKSLLEAVDRIWQQTVNERPQLHNGGLFNLHRREGQTFWGSFTQYKYWIAQRRRPELAAELGIQPLAVTGAVFCKDGWVLARRGRDVMQDPGRWELAPAGGIDDSCAVENGVIHAEEQLFKELDEELGLKPEHISQLKVFGFVEDLETRVHDLVFELKVALSGEQVQDAFRRVHSSESTELRIVPTAGIVEFLESNQAQIAPITFDILALRGLWPRRNG